MDDIFKATLAKKQAALAEQLSNFHNDWISHTVTSQSGSIDRIMSAAQEIQAYVSSEYWPKWLRNIIAACALYQKKHESPCIPLNVFKQINANMAEARKHLWQVSSDVPPLLDFDAIVDSRRDRETIQSLYDKLIESLETVLGCDEIDSLRATNDLQRMLATLRKSRDGSFYGQLISLEAAGRFVKNFGTTWVKETKIAKVAIKAAEDTLEEMGLTMEEAKANINSDVRAVLDAVEQPLLKTKAPNALPGPKDTSDQNPP